MKNSNGQLGLGDYNDSPTPKNINFDFDKIPNKIKICQISAGFRSSFFLTETRQLFCCGTLFDFAKKKSPVKFNLKSKVFNFFKVYKVCNCFWCMIRK